MNQRKINILITVFLKSVRALLFPAWLLGFILHLGSDPLKHKSVVQQDIITFIPLATLMVLSGIICSTVTSSSLDWSIVAGLMLFYAILFFLLSRTIYTRKFLATLIYLGFGQITLILLYSLLIRFNWSGWLQSNFWILTQIIWTYILHIGLLLALSGNIPAKFTTNITNKKISIADLCKLDFDGCLNNKKGVVIKSFLLLLIISQIIIIIILGKGSLQMLDSVSNHTFFEQSAIIFQIWFILYMIEAEVRLVSSSIN